MATTPQTNATLAKIAEVVKAHDDFVLCGHVSPDGDCLGSQLALWHALRAIGKRAACVLVRDEPIGPSLAFMPGMDAMVPAERFEGAARTFVALDVPTRERIGDAARILDQCDASITIDHHACDTTMCDYVHVDPDAASTSMLVWELVKMLVADPPVESASCAYVGLATDTGGFRFLNADEAAFSAAADLIEHGVNPASIAASVFQNRTLASLQLEKAIIERLTVFHDGEAALSWVTQDDFERIGATKADAEPLIDTVRSLAGVRVACVLREQDGKVRGSLRSKDSIDVSALARELNGGGHKAAAGFTLEQPLPEAVGAITSKISGLLDA